LASRDKDFENEVFEDISANFKIADGKVENKKSSDMPVKLVDEAIGKIKAINIKHAKVKSKEVQKKAQEIVEEGVKILGNKGQIFILKQVIKWLEKVNADHEDALEDVDKNNKDDILESLTDIQKLSYRVSKKVKKI